MRFTNARLLLFSKAPYPGSVMTRLQPALGADGAARLHGALTRHAVALASGADLCPVQLWCTPTVEHPLFRDCARDFGVALHTQQGEDLGERMLHALDRALQDSDQALIMGCDCPSLTAADLCRALQWLSDGLDAVVGPAEDGGYVLLGLRRTDPALFRAIPWGSDRVTAVTRRRLRGLRWRWHELPRQWDVDRPRDLRRLAATALWDGGQTPAGRS